MNDLLKQSLTDAKLTPEQIEVLDKEGVSSVDEIASLSASDLKGVLGCGLFEAQRIITALKPTVPPPSPALVIDPNAPIPEGQNPGTAQVNEFAKNVGMDPNLLSAMIMGQLVNGMGGEMDMSSLMPTANIVPGYSPKIRNINYLVMGQLEKQFSGYPIVVINDDGSINVPFTIERITDLQEGRVLNKEEENTFYAGDSAFDVIRVGVDAQSIYDSDPIVSSSALPKSQVGTGRIKWLNISLPVRQVIYYASTHTHEISENDETKISWLRTNLRQETKVGQLQGEFPEAVKMYREHQRMGDLPTLKVQLTNSRARRPETMPRRSTRPSPEELKHRLDTDGHQSY